MRGREGGRGKEGGRRTAADVVVGVVCGPDSVGCLGPGVAGGGEEEGRGEDDGCVMHFVGWRVCGVDVGVDVCGCAFV